MRVHGLLDHIPLKKFSLAQVGDDLSSVLNSVYMVAFVKILQVSQEHWSVHSRKKQRTHLAQHPGGCDK